MPLLPLRQGSPVSAHPRADERAFHKFVQSKQSPLFVGRTDELAQLDQMLAKTAPGTFNIAIIQGAPGSGKTQLAIEYALQGRTDSRPYKPFLIQASTISIFEAGLKRFLRLLRKQQITTPELINTWEAQDRDVHDTVRSKLERAVSAWVLIIDDITEDTFEHAQNLIPKAYPKSGQVILTTRKPHLAEMLEHGPDLHVRDTMLLKGMKEEDALELLARIADPYSDRAIRFSKPDEAYRVTLGMLNCLPMLVNQFASFINQQSNLVLPNKPSDPFIEQVCRHRYSDPPWLPAKPGDSLHSFHDIWAAILLQLRKQREVAADLLCMMSFLHAENVDIEALSRAFTREYNFDKLCDTEESAFLRVGNRFARLQALLSDSEELNVVLEMLVYMGILTTQPGPSAQYCFASSMTQVAVRTALMPSFASRLQWLQFTLCAYQAAFLPIGDFDILEYTQTMAPHVERLWDHCREQRYCSRTLCEVLLYRAERLQESGRYLQALQWVKKAVQCVSIYKDDHEWISLRDKVGMAFGLLCLRIALTDNNNEMLSQADEIIRTRYEYCKENLGFCSETDDATKAFVQILIARGEVTQVRFMINTLLKQIDSCEKNPSVPPIEALQLQDSLVQAYAFVARSLHQLHLLKAAHDLSHATLAAKESLCPDDEEELAVTLEGLAMVQWESHKCPGKNPGSPQNSEIRLMTAGSAVKQLKRARKLLRVCLDWDHPEVQRISKTIAAWKADIKASKKARIRSESKNTKDVAAI